MTYKLFLDDLRPPPDSSWIVVRSVDAAVLYCNSYGIPREMSLDHDLGGGDDAPAFLRYLIDRCIDAQDFDPTQIIFNVHSANPVGVKNLNGLWESFIEFFKRNFAKS